MNILVKKIIVLALILFSLSISYSQTTDDIKKEADNLFKKEQFIEATPLYLQLLNVEPRNHELNYKYGTCLLFSSQDKSEAIRFLSFSVKNASIESNAFFYLGKAYHLNFEFSRAITNYEKFKGLGSSALIKRFNIEANINACHNGRQLLTNITDMIVIEKTEVNKEDFYELYELNDIGGSLLVTDQFQTKYDKKMGHRPIIYFPEGSPYIFYSSYGEEGKTGLDIYVKQKLPSSKWSEAIKVVGDVNTSLDEDYPYLSPDGKFLYYSSKGHNSMGGYDVFRSKVIIEGSSFSSPENMDFAISSPNDDILYIVDSLDRTAYFSSARESQFGKLFVYKVRVEKIPMKIIVIKGEFVNTIDPGNKDIEIIVKNGLTGEQLGTYYSKSRSGDIIFTTPRSGKYKFELTVDGSDVTHLAEVSIPIIKELRPLKMTITHEYNDMSQEVIRVTPLFEELFDNPSEIMAEVFQEKSKLNPNAGNYDLDSLNKLRNSDDVFVEAGLDVYVTPEDVQEVLKKSIAKLNFDNETNKSNSLIAHHLANKKQEQADAKLKEVNDLIESSETEIDESAKKAKLSKAYQLAKESGKLNQEAAQLIAVADKIEDEIDNNEKLINNSETALVEVKSIEQKDRESLVSFVSKNQKVLVKANAKHSSDVLAKIEKEGKAEQLEKNEILDKISDLNSRIDLLKSQQISLNETLISTKKKKEKESIQGDIQSVESELGIVQDELMKQDGKMDRFAAKDVSGVDLSNATNEITSDINQTTDNKSEISNTQKLKIKYAIENNEFDNEIAQANKIFTENGISANYADLEGLGEDMFAGRTFETIEDIDDEIYNLEDLIAESDDEEEIAKYEYQIERLNKIRVEKFDESGTPIIASNTNSEQLGQGTIIKKDDLVKDFSERLLAINSIADINDRKAKENELNKSLNSEIDQKIKEKEKELKEDENNEDIQTDLDNLYNLKQDVEENIKDYKKWQDDESSKDSESVFSYQDALSIANPAYESKVNQIYNGTFTEEEQQEELALLNNSTISGAKERLQEVEAIIESGESSEYVLSEQKQLNKLVDELENNITQPLIEPSISVNLSQVSEDVEPNQLVENYKEKIEKINQSPNSALDKEKAKLLVNQELVSKINNEILQLESAIENKNERSKLYEDRAENLTKLKEEKLDEISSSRSIISKITEEQPELISTVESIYPEYTTKSYEINELESDEEKSEAIIELNKTAIAEINQELKELKIANNANPRDELLYTIKELESLTNAIQKNIDKDYYGVVVYDNDDNDLANIKSGVTVEDIIPDLESRLQDMEEQAISKKDLEKKKISLNQEIIAKVEQEVRQLENAKNTVPSNVKTFEKRIENLEEIKSTSINAIEASKAVIGEEYLEYDVVVEVNDANPNYLEEVDEINLISNKSEQIQAVENLNQSTLELIDDKIFELNAEVEENPSDKKKLLLIEKYKELQAEIIANPDQLAEGELTNELVPEIKPKTNDESIEEDTTDNVEFPVIYEEVTLEEIVPGYNTKITEIQNSTKPSIELEEDKVALYDEVLDEIDREKKELETYLLIDSPNKVFAEKKLENLETIESVILTEKSKSNAFIADNSSNGDVLNDISEIMPDYETRKENIEYASDSELDKKQKTNELNNVLLHEIDKKLASLDEELKSETANSELIEENIEKLEELSDAITTEIDQNNAFIDNELANSNSLEEEEIQSTNLLDPEIYINELSEEKISSIKSDLIIVSELNAEIDELSLKQARVSEKEGAKLNKSINKLKTKQSELENELINELSPLIKNDLSNLLTESKENELEVRTKSIENVEIRNADEQLAIAIEKIEKANDLRSEAENIKSSIISNELLNQAVKLESEAIGLLTNSNRIYRSAIVIDNMTSSETIVVLENNEDDDLKESSRLYDLADDIDRDADELELRAVQLKDSAATIKKKYRQAVIDQAVEIEYKVEDLRLKAEDLRFEASEVENQEDQMAELMPDKIEKEVSKIDQAAVLKSDTYQKYYEEKVIADEIIEKAKAIEKSISTLKTVVDRKIRMAIVEGQDVDEDVLSEDPEISSILNEIDSLRTIQENYKNQAISHYSTASQILNNASESSHVKENMIAMTNQKIQPETVVKLTGEDVDNTVALFNNEDISVETSTDYIPPKKLDRQIFRQTEEAVYSDDRPIPVNAVEPEGLIYKVQVGAFRKPLPPQHFNKFAPISGQKLNNGITRFMVGYFTNYVPANTAKSEIHQIGGYNDAFVVAYLNGERISISEARAIEESGIIPVPTIDEELTVNPIRDNETVNEPESIIETEQEVNQTQNNENANENNAINTNEPQENVANTNSTIDADISFEPISEEELTKTDYYTSVPDAAKANQVEIISGLFFTVQIGVYSKPVPISELFNVTPLNSQLIEGRKIRYSTGIYNTVEQASERKQELIELGLVDAFVTAYYNGERITIAKAKELLNEEGNTVLFSGKTISEESGTSNSRYNKENVYYRILIGRYENYVPSTVANYLFNDDNIFFETELDADNNVYLYTQKFQDLNDVKKRLVEINELGFDNMKIISYYNIQMIPFIEASKIAAGLQETELTEYDYPDGIEVNDFFYEADAIYYRVEFGEYETEIPNNIIVATNEVSEYGVEQETNAEGNIILHTSNINTFAEAEEVFETVIDAIPAAKIIAFHKYVQITVDKAKEIKGE